MDDIDTRLEAERPEVADVLKSMNWEERLEQARARRRAVLDRNVADDKRPVVRIIDAAAVARKRADAQSDGPARPVRTPVHSRADVAPEPTVALAATTEASLPEAAPPRDKASIAGRTALGFGLGLGIGASVVAGAFLLVGLPGARSVPTETASVAVTTPAPMAASAPADAPATAAPVVTPVAVAPAPAVPAPSVAPRVPAVQPRELAPPTGEEYGATPVLAALATGPVEGPVPAIPAALAPDAVPLMAALPRPPVLGRIDLAFSGPTATAEPAVFPVSSAAAPLLPRSRAGLEVPAAPGNGAPILDGAISRPGAGLAPAAPFGLATSVLDVVVPSGAASPILAALPAAPGAIAPPQGRPMASVAPPAPPPPVAEATDPEIPGAASMFVRLAVPQTVPDAEAEEIAGLLKELGIGDSRVTRVGYKVTESHVRYYRREDAEAATILAGILGTEARDHTSFRPRPPDGTLEVFLAGERTAPPPRVATAPTRARPPQHTQPQSQPPDPTAAMRDRIVNRLRRGEHL